MISRLFSSKMKNVEMLWSANFILTFGTWFPGLTGGHFNPASLRQHSWLPYYSSTTVSERVLAIKSFIIHSYAFDKVCQYLSFYLHHMEFWIQYNPPKQKQILQYAALALRERGCHQHFLGRAEDTDSKLSRAQTQLRTNEISSNFWFTIILAHAHFTDWDTGLSKFALFC